MAWASVLTSTNYVSRPETLAIDVLRTQDSLFEIECEQKIHEFQLLFSVFGAEINNPEYLGSLVQEIVSSYSKLAASRMYIPLVTTSA